MEDKKLYCTLFGIGFIVILLLFLIPASSTTEEVVVIQEFRPRMHHQPLPIRENAPKTLGSLNEKFQPEQEPKQKMKSRFSIDDLQTKPEEKLMRTKYGPKETFGYLEPVEQTIQQNRKDLKEKSVFFS